MSKFLLRLDVHNHGIPHFPEVFPMIQNERKRLLIEKYLSGTRLNAQIYDRPLLHIRGMLLHFDAKNRLQDPNLG